MDQEGLVSALYIFQEKGKPGFPVKTCRFIQGLGMEGDRHAWGGERQVTILSREVRRWMEAQTVPGLCFKRYKANIETRGFLMEHVRPGTRIRIGTAAFEVSESGKECFPECSLFQASADCRLSSGGIYLKVIESGTVSENDKIVIFA